MSEHFIEDLGNGIGLEMVLIPGGSFMMGSPADEEGHYDDESPQHLVNIKPFYMGKYPVTQAQWKTVAALPKVKYELNPEQSTFSQRSLGTRFIGGDFPVENVCWIDAVEFCDRLSHQTKRKYRLPSEAEWEYACRAGTTTPFHFGETITTDLANYNGNDTYGTGSKGIYREDTTPVGSFGVANAFGLYDMHGNVEEWCADHSHQDYKGVPLDGSAWLSDKDSFQAFRVHRGGCWDSNPIGCRSAYRGGSPPNVMTGGPYGFRVVCAVAKA